MHLTSLAFLARFFLTFFSFFFKWSLSLNDTTLAPSGLVPCCLTVLLYGDLLRRPPPTGTIPVINVVKRVLVTLGRKIP